MIYIQNKKREKNETLYQFLEPLFKLNKTYSNGCFLVNTYKNKECTTIQCYLGNHRSFDEIVIICQTYYKNVTPRFVAKTLEKFILNYPKLKLGFVPCGTANKWIFHGGAEWGNYYSKYRLPYHEYKLSSTKLGGVYSLDDIINFMEK